MLDAVAKDGIRLLVKARVTVRANLERLVGGAKEDTIIARVGQGIVSAIGSSPSYKDVLENPDQISRKVLDSGLDAQTGFEIVSIDIADISVAGVADVANVGALLETERAEADKKMRQAEAEGRRAMAVAQEQEMRARVQEMQAKVVEAQAEVPRAMAQAFREGNLGVMDYYRMQNIESDTTMRESIAGEGLDEERGPAESGPRPRAIPPGNTAADRPCDRRSPARRGQCRTHPRSGTQAGRGGTQGSARRDGTAPRRTAKRRYEGAYRPKPVAG